MKKIFFILIVIFTVSSCTYEESGFRRISKNEAMQSWAWKIFIFTDEGETQPIKAYQNNFDNSIKEKSIFVDEIWEIDLKNDLFFKNSEVAIEEKAFNTDFAKTKEK